MSSTMDRAALSKWITDELDRRGWTASELGRRAGVNRQVIGTYINQQRKQPDEQILGRIARAFGYPPEVPLRVAGMLPPPASLEDEIDDQLQYRLARLTPEQKKRLLKYLDFFEQDEIETKDTREGASPPEVIKKRN